MESKIFIEFVALIVRNKIYTNLKDDVERNDKREKYMDVSAAIRELEKIEMVRQAEMYKAKKQYESRVEEVNRLLKLRDKEKMEEMLTAVANSKHSYEDIMVFVKSQPIPQEE